MKRGTWLVRAQWALGISAPHPCLRAAELGLSTCSSFRKKDGHRASYEEAEHPPCVSQNVDSSPH